MFNLSMFWCTLSTQMKREMKKKFKQQNANGGKKSHTKEVNVQNHNATKNEEEEEDDDNGKMRSEKVAHID